MNELEDEFGFHQWYLKIYWYYFVFVT